MQKHHNFPLLVLSSSVLATSMIGYGSWIIYSPTSKKEGFSLPKTSDRKVCYIGNDYYTSIGRAIEESKSGDTIVVIPGNKSKSNKNYVITPTKPGNIADKKLEIPSGVTLSIPYEEGKTNTKKPQDTGLGKGCTINSKDNSGNLTYLTSSVWLDDSITLVNNGTIEIGGVLGSYSGSNPTGGTSGNFAALFLGNKSVLENKGTLNVYGLLGETTKDNNSQLVCEPSSDNAKSYLYLPFYWYDYCGGSALKAIYDQIDSKKCLPVDDFFFNNITPEATFKKGTVVTSWVNLNAASNNGEYDLTVIDDSGVGILTLQDGGYINCNYDEDTLVSNLDLYGKVSINEFKIDVEKAIREGASGLAWTLASAMGVPSKVTSTSGYFPISYHWNISMNQNEAGTGTFDGGNGRFKLLNGSKLKVGKGASFSFSELVGYNGEDYYTGRGTHAVALRKSKNPNREPASVIVNGNLSGDLVAANITSEESDASILVSNSTSITTYEPKAGEGDKTSAKMYDGEQGWFYLYPKLRLKDENGTVNEIEQSGKYVSASDNTGFYWNKNESKDISRVSISSTNGSTATSANSKGTFKLSATVSPEGHTSTIVGYKWHVSAPSGGSGGNASFDNDSIESPTLTIPANSNTGSDTLYKVWLDLTFVSTDSGTQQTISSGEITFTGTKKSSGGCFTKGTLILCEDGRYKPIEKIRVGDSILTWSHEKGKVESQIVAFIPYHSEDTYEVLELTFENGKSIKVLFAHGFMNCRTRQYEEISLQNVSKKLGTEYLFVTNDGKLSKSKLISYKSYFEITECYSISSAYNLNHIINGALCISDDIEGLYNYFELNPNYRYDEEKKEKDISVYGLLSFDDVSDFMPFEIYDMFNAKYLSVSIGKRLITMGKMREYIKKYAS